MSNVAPNPASSIEAGISGSSAQFDLTMAEPDMYMFVANTACWIAQGSNPTASAASGSMYVPANVQIFILPCFGAKLAVIQDAGGGKGSLTPVRFVR